MRFAVGVTTTFSIMARLDRIVVICKTYVQASLAVVLMTDCWAKVITFPGCTTMLYKYDVMYDVFILK